MLPDMTATVNIITQSADNALLVPNGAINNGEVSVLRNSAPVSVAVQTGITDGINTQIVAGLQPGEQVITGLSSGTSSKSSSSSSGSNIFGFGGPGGGGNNRQNDNGQQPQQRGGGQNQTGAGAPPPGGPGGPGGQG
jgi:hypothetical protein